MVTRGWTFARVQTRALVCTVLLSAWLGGTTPALGSTEELALPKFERWSLVEPTNALPAWGDIVEVLSLRDYNTRVVVLGTMLLGLAAGTIGSFMLLRKRALLADALSHATLPGIAIAFIVMVTLGGTGKWLPGLLAGALISGVIGVATILAIVHLTRIKEDVALGIVLSVLFGFGIAALGVVQSMEAGNQAGLESFIYGKTASMLKGDAVLIGIVAGVVALLCVLLFKEFALLCFDADYSSTQGWPVVWLDVVMMALVVAVTVIGLQAVGLILVIALLVIPPAAARFWTEHLPTMVITSAIFGALSGMFGAGLSALTPKLPAGAVIVIVAGVFFGFSMVFGRARGVLVRSIRLRQLTAKVARQNALRALFELREVTGKAAEAAQSVDGGSIPFEALLDRRSWSRRQLRSALRSARRRNLVEEAPRRGRFRLTAGGLEAARRLVRNHRLWELFLLTHADTAPSLVDRDADEVEHVLQPEMVAELEALLAAAHPGVAMPASPHKLRPVPSAAGRGDPA